MRRPLLILATLLLLPAALPAQSAEFHIINGQPADPGEYPAMAALTERAQSFQFCGGTLIDPEWILTAAHCFYDSRTGGSNIPAESLEIVLDTPDWTQGGERLSVDRIVINPDYDEFRTVNDIALLHLSTTAITPPASLVTAEQASLYAAGRPAVVTGYGTTTPDGTNPSTRLLEVDLPLVSDADCASSYDLEADRHVCAGAPGTEDNPGPDTCQGDSGGPLWTDRGDGVLTLIGITSFGGLCGVRDPGVYTEVITYLAWVAGIIDGSIPDNTPDDPTVPDLPDDSTVPPTRVTFDASGTTSATTQAIGVSRAVFRDAEAAFGVIATSARYPDALGGASLAYGLAPLLFTEPDGSLSAVTLTELRRAVTAGAIIYVLGGEAVIPAPTVSQLTSAGFVVERVAGAGREETAALVAQLVVTNLQTLPRDTVIVATGGNWPDAVTAGQIGSWWGVPVLLTPPSSLNGHAADFLARNEPAKVLIAGGPSAISDEVFSAIAAVPGVGEVKRLGGATRFETAGALTRYNLDELFGSSRPQFIVAVNLRREPDAFTHVLSASMLTGAYEGIMAAVEGDGGVTAPQSVLDSVCGVNVPVLIAGDTDLIADSAVASIAAAAGGQNCDAVGLLQVGQATQSAITPSLPSRFYDFTGTAGQQLQIRMDVGRVPGTGNDIDPRVLLYAPDGTLVGENDDRAPGELSSLLQVTLTQDGVHRIEATRFGDTTGRFILTLDAQPSAVVEGRLSSAEPTQSYPVSGPPGGRMVVEMRVTGPGTDPLLRALGSTGEVLAEDDDGGGFPNARLTVRFPADGQLVIQAASFLDFYGSYQVLFSDPDRVGLAFG